MSLEDRIQALKAKHEALDSKLEYEATRPLPDESIIIGLKRQKLKIKDELASLN